MPDTVLETISEEIEKLEHRLQRLYTAREVLSDLFPTKPKAIPTGAIPKLPSAKSAAEKRELVFQHLRDAGRPMLSKTIAAEMDLKPQEVYQAMYELNRTKRVVKNGEGSYEVHPRFLGTGNGPRTSG